MYWVWLAFVYHALGIQVDTTISYLDKDTRFFTPACVCSVSKRVYAGVLGYCKLMFGALLTRQLKRQPICGFLTTIKEVITNPSKYLGLSPSNFCNAAQTPLWQVAQHGNKTQYGVFQVGCAQPPLT